MSILSDRRAPKPALAAEEVAGVFVALDVADRRLLELEWRADGALRRQGDGREGGGSSRLVEGQVGAAAFEHVRRHVLPELLSCRGNYSDRAARGGICRLEVVLYPRHGAKWTSVWNYGTESAGPPEPVRRFVTALVQLTRAWYEQGQSPTRKGRVGR